MSKTLKDNAGISISGHVLIKDLTTGEIVLDKFNAINYENITFVIANLLSNIDADTPGPNGDGTGYHVFKIAYGNGGTVIDSNGNITYRTVNVDGPTAGLYNQTYEKSCQTIDSSNQTIVVEHGGNPYSDVVITSTLDYAEPSIEEGADEDQLFMDNATNDTETSFIFDEYATNDTETSFIFDELGIKIEEGRFLTHIIFHPIQKSANRRLQVKYTLRIRAGS
jgi:hypothetical protein